MPYIDFAELKSRVGIDRAADLLGLVVKREGAQLRAACPVCNQDGDRAIVLTPAKGLFYCFAAKKGGDCIHSPRTSWMSAITTPRYSWPTSSAWETVQVTR